jgi:molecular chaperone DnaJ
VLQQPCATVELGIADAALGGTAVAPTLDGTVEVKVRNATQPGDQLRLRGRGLPELGSSRKGDLFVQFRVQVPKTLTPRQRELLEEFQAEEWALNNKPVASEKEGSAKEESA